MTATLHYLDDERTLLRGIKGELNRWGKWIEEHLWYEGYPTYSIGANVVSYGGGQPGHRVLCLDMPTGVYAVHHRVLMLPELEREAIWIWHVFRVLPDGTEWPVGDKCRLTQIPEGTLRQRCHRARKRIAGLLIDAA